MTPTLSPDQEEAVAEMISGRSVFLNGGGGTGKSTTIEAFKAKARGRSIATLATTGAAAQLISGQTMHGFFGMGSGVHKPHDLSMPKSLAAKLRATQTVIVDEISMARIDHFQCMRDRLFGAARGFGDFGGYQLIVVGDFAQLPPVTTPGEAPVLDELYGPGKRFAHQSRYWRNLSRVDLKVVHRQAGDAPWAEWLASARRGEIGDLDLINSRVMPLPMGAVALVASRRSADTINGRMMEQLPGGSFRIEGQVTGEFPERDMRVPQEMKLKRNSRVIICANSADGGYANGSSGLFIECKRDAKGMPVAVVMLDDGRLVDVHRHTWTNVEHRVTRNAAGEARIETHDRGSYSQLPVLPGWAITIHRSQGMSLDRAHFDPTGIFVSGQAYVALSRVRTLEGLTMQAPLHRDHFMIAEDTAGETGAVREGRSRAA